MQQLKIDDKAHWLRQKDWLCGAVVVTRQNSWMAINAAMAASECVSVYRAHGARGTPSFAYPILGLGIVSALIGMVHISLITAALAGR